MTDQMPTAAVAAAAVDDNELVEADELIALIKAIKFAYDDYGCKRVHDEIKTHGGKYTRVPLKRVKKYMQKLGMTNAEDGKPQAAEQPKKQQQDEDAPAQDAKKTTGKKKQSNAALKQQAQDASTKPGAIELMTVGGNSKSARPDGEGEAAQASEADDKWLPVKLDEPASKMSNFPYQAVIRMTNSDEGDANGEMGEIYKIQVAMGSDGSLSSVHPMLMYNKARDRKTFLHPDSPAYLPVLRLIKARGFNGNVGGAKAYFWGRYRQKDDMVYINREKLAPFQKW